MYIQPFGTSIEIQFCITKIMIIDMVKNTIKEKGVPEKLAYLKGYDLLTNEVKRRGI